MSNETKKPTYWRSFDELAQSEDWKSLASHEFEYGTSLEPLGSGQTRRHFLGIMGASMAMTGLTGCLRRPEETIMPYVNMPEHVVPGIPSYYATSTHINGDVIGLLVESHEGRPTKIEGNPLHPSSRGSFTEGTGGTTATHQGMVLELYDPQRLRYPAKNGGKIPMTWESVSKKISEVAADAGKTQGKKLRILSEPNPSPTMQRLRDQLIGRPNEARGRLPFAKWYTFDALSYDNERQGLLAAFRKPMRAVPDLQNARFIMSLGSDFLGTEHGSVAASADWAKKRSIGTMEMATTRTGEPAPDKTQLDVTMNRLFVAETVMSLTGSNADHRIRLGRHQMDAFGAQLALAMQEINAISIPAELAALIQKKAQTKLPENAIKMARAFAQDIQNTVIGDAEGPLVIVGRSESPFLHNLAAFLNHGRQRRSMVRYYEDFSRPQFVTSGQPDAGDFGNLKALTAELNSGAVDTLVILGTNPGYHAPGDLDFANAVKKAKNVIVLSDQGTETTKLSTLSLPRAHFLESWGDTQSSTGDASIQQPLIKPLHGAWSDLELVLRLLGESSPDAHKAVQATWKDRMDAPGGDFDLAWQRALADGLIAQDRLRPSAATSSMAYSGTAGMANDAPKAPAKDALHLFFVADAHLGDGRFATSSVLQETPDPITKVTWDNVAMMSPKTAAELGIEKPSQIGHTATERVEITAEVGGKEATLNIPAWIVPGMADYTVAVAIGYGRDFDSYLPYHESGKIGVSVSEFRTTASPDFVAGAKLSRSGRMYPIACVQRFDSQTPDAAGFDQRPLVRETTVDEFKKDPTFAKPGLIMHGHYPQKTVGKGKNQKQVDYLVAHPPTEALHDGPHRNADYSTGYQWAMAIDLNKCTGCNACLVACVTENNIPAVGKEQVRVGRELHWLRLDRYFVGDENEPAVVHQPLTCSQCEMAPCENVCPVGATAHSPEGLNDMAYNRCIGTRYCSNNCPFKVRRFNFFNYSNSASSWEGLKIRNDKTVDVATEDQLAYLGRNPDVSVRFRGVMEKCTYCVQRINKGKNDAKLAATQAEAEKHIADIKPACQQVCSTDCITFGDKNNPNSAVSKVRSNPRNYALLTELNLRPRTTYLGKVRNPSPYMAEG